MTNGGEGEIDVDVLALAGELSRQKVQFTYMLQDILIPDGNRADLDSHSHPHTQQ